MFNKVKEIRSKSGELHFIRWKIFSIGNFSVNIHKICKADEDKHLHNHPWNFMSIVLKGGYIERLQSGKANLRTFLNTAIRRAEKFHKIDEMVTKTVYTLNFMWGERKEWGYDVGGKFVQHEEYRNLKREGKL